MNHRNKRLNSLSTEWTHTVVNCRDYGTTRFHKGKCVSFSEPPEHSTTFCLLWYTEPPHTVWTTVDPSPFCSQLYSDNYIKVETTNEFVPESRLIRFTRYLFWPVYFSSSSSLPCPPSLTPAALSRSGDGERWRCWQLTDGSIYRIRLWEESVNGNIWRTSAIKTLDAWSRTCDREPFPPSLWEWDIG